MALNQTPPQFSVGIDAKGKLICQEENLEPGVLKLLENFFVTVDAKFNHIFTLEAGEIDKPIPFGSITDAKVLFVYAQDAIELKINSIGSAAIPIAMFSAQAIFDFLHVRSIVFALYFVGMRQCICVGFQGRVGLVLIGVRLVHAVKVGL